jgi:putative ABC transport system permease protein
MTRFDRAMVAGFRALMRLMPASYSRAQRDEATALMARLVEDARRRQGVAGVTTVAVPAFADLIWRIVMDSARWALAWESLRRDLRNGVRAVRRRPVHSAAVIATLALGIGLNAAVYSVVDWVLLRPLPYPAAEELARVWVDDAKSSGPGLVSYTQVAQAGAAGAVRAVTGLSMATRIASSDRFEPMHITVARVTGDLFAVFGQPPRVGRGFDARETASGRPVVVISDTMWRNRFSAHPGIGGELLTIDNVAHTIVGVMPAGRGYPREADVWRPATDDEREDDDRENVVIARLSGGPSEAARSQLAAAMLAGSTQQGQRIAVESLQSLDAGRVRTALLLIFGASLLVLVIAAANVAALLGTRGIERAGEWAVRGALGARSGQLARQLAVESGLLAMAGGAAGLLLGSWMLQAVVALAPAGMPRLDEIALDGRVGLLSALILVIVGAGVSLSPTRTATRVDLRSALVGTSVRVSGHFGGRRALVGAQIMLAVMLAIGAALLTRSLQHLLAIDHGFQPDGVIAVNLNLRGTAPDASVALFHTLVDAAATVPGVRSAAVSFRLPTEVAGLRIAATLEGEAPATVPAVLRLVTPAYFDTVGIPVVDGRALTATDTRQRPRVALVNRAFARAAGDRGAILDRAVTTDVIDGRITIVGVVADVTPAGEADRPALYVSFDQFAINAGSLLVRVAGDPRAFISVLMPRLRAAAPGLPLDRVQTLPQALAAGRAVARFSTILASLFGVLAMALALIGIYGLSAIEVGARRREIGVRLALGASRGAVLRDMVLPIGRTMLAGLIAGVTGAVALSLSMRAAFEGVQPLDPLAFVALPAVLAAAGAAAALLAAWPLCLRSALSVLAE